MGVLGEVLLGSFVAVLASVLGPVLLEAIVAHEPPPSTVAVLGTLGSAFGGFVAGMMHDRAEWIRGVGVGAVLTAYHHWRATLPDSTAAGTVSATALPAALIGALASAWLAGPGREDLWRRMHKRAGAAVLVLRILGAVVALAWLVGPGTAAVGFAGVFVALMAGYLRGPVQTVAIFMEDKCRRRAG